MLVSVVQVYISFDTWDENFIFITFSDESKLFNWMKMFVGSLEVIRRMSTFACVDQSKWSFDTQQEKCARISETIVKVVISSYEDRDAAIKGTQYVIWI